MKTAYIFPAFVSEYLGTENQILDDYSSNFRQLLAETSRITGDDFSSFSIHDKAFTEDELRSQLISYLFSCSCNDLLMQKGLKPDVLAGYSMGIYAALYAGGAITFEEGVKLIKQAFLMSKAAIGKIESGMGTVIGLTREEIGKIISQYRLEAEIGNTNSLHAHLVTGTKTAVSQLLEKARETGALNVSVLNVGTPYHSKLLKATATRFGEFIAENIRLKPPAFPLISTIDQNLLDTRSAISEEIIRNLFSKINWMDTFNHIIGLGVNQFVECGAGKSLQKIGRFIPGDFTIYPMNKYDKLF